MRSVKETPRTESWSESTRARSESFVIKALSVSPLVCPRTTARRDVEASALQSSGLQRL